MLRKNAKYPKAVQVDIDTGVNLAQVSREEILEGMKDWLKVLTNCLVFHV